jgi:RHS repeat-associated protein
MSGLMIALARRIAGRRSRLVVGGLAVVLVASLVTFALPATSAPTALSPQVDKPIPGVPLAARARPADPAAAAAARTAKRTAPVWPTTAAARVDGAGARVTVLDRAAARAAGVSGALMRVERTDATARSARISVDYGQFATAYGADWAARLRLVRLPGCAATTPTAPGCTRGTPLPSTNDTKARRITATVDLAADSVVALMSEPSGSAGDYSATPLTPSSTWSAGGNSGDFSWSYPIRVPPSLGGPAPTITLGYSSQSVDGRSAATNNQPSWLGEGFEWWPGSIERRYRTCADDVDTPGRNNTTPTGDQCWETDNATLSLSGHSSELIKDPTDPKRWRLRDDDGTLVMRHTGAGNGDNDGEWWQVITPDGTEYRFGATPAANSTWTVPVFGNDPNEPCNKPTFAASSCVRAWRWNLDTVVDRRANTMTYIYEKETGAYGRNNSTTDLAAYVRGGYLKTINYGTRVGGSGPAPMQVSFEVDDRCLTTTCATHDEDEWTDVPWDLHCAAAPCHQHGPAFWSTKRLASITTKVWNASATPAAYRPVESWTFTHTFPDPGDGTRAGLWLARISHAGLVGGTTTVPDVTFTGTQLANRVDTLSDSLLPMNWWRVSRIDTESGGAVIVKYSEPDCVPGSRMPNTSALQNNGLRCYPSKWTRPGTSTPLTDFFHKYVVTEVREGDLVGGAPDVVHTYRYEGDPAWHYTDDDGLTKPEFRTWSGWRGYATVATRTGDEDNTRQTSTVTHFFRGMHGDRLPSGTRSVTLPAVDVNNNGTTDDANVDAPAAADEDAFAGMTRMSVTYDGPGGAEVSATVSEPWQSAPTASRTINGTTVHARYVDAAATHSRLALDTDHGTRPAAWRTTSTRTTFDEYGMPVESDDRGDDAVSGDETCHLTTYVRHADQDHGVWLTQFVSRLRGFAVGCARATSGPLTEDDILADERTSYDELAFGAAPTRGLVTEKQVLKTYHPTNPGYLTVSRARHDDYGRPTQTWDVDGNRSTTVYTPAIGGPVTEIRVTNPLEWTTTTAFEPAWGSPVTVVDVNNRRTEFSYDGLGRTTAVWLPGRIRTANQSPSLRFSYQVRTDGANAVTTSKLNPAGGYTTAVSLYDGLLRPRQTQSPDASIADARVVTDTLYDSAGRAWKATRAYPMTGVPGPDVYVPRPPDYSGPEAIPAWTENQYDGAGRVIATVLKARNEEKWRTVTGYTGDRTDVTPPQGGTATSTVTDVRGRTVALRHYHGPAPAGTHDTTTYGYNRKGQLTEVTDARGSRWTHRYDLLGRRTRTDDPDKGRVTRGYDDAGRLTTSTDARDVTLAYTYDVLGRKTSARNGTATGTKRAEWIYDTVAKGLLTRSVRYDDAGAAYTTEVVGYNAYDSPLSIRYVLPASETGFGATTFTYVNTYNVDGSPATTRLPAAGDLGQENLSTGYTGHGRPATLGTSLGGTLVTGTGYTNYGETNILSLRNNSGGIIQIGQYYEDDTRRLHEIRTTTAVEPTTTFGHAVYRYTAAGDVNRIVESVSGETQCFGYDHLRRLTQAWTPSSGDCAAAPTVAGLGGPAKYWQSWTFDAAGDRLSQTDHATVNTTATYTYPAATGPRPHAVTSVGYAGAITRTDTYAYDANGNTTSRPGQTLTWDAEDRLATSTGSGGTTAYLYDVDGGRLVRRDPAGKTLYLPGQEIRHTTSTGTARTTRYYTFAGRAVATRTASGLTWLAGDHQGTAQLAITATTQAVAVRRFTPYGAPRGTVSGTWPSMMDKGFVGGTLDNTGLTHLGAREYDPSLGRFISVDPVFDEKDPQSWQGYAYAGNTPVTASDPTGLVMCARLEDPSGPCIDRMNTSAGQKTLARAEDNQRRYWASYCQRHPFSCGMGKPDPGGSAFCVRPFGSDKCMPPGPPGQPRPPDKPRPEGAPLPGYRPVHGYDYDWRLGSASEVGTPEQIMAQFQARPGDVFPFGLGRCTQIILDQKCDLHVAPGVADDEWVRITSVSDTSFTFTTLPGHFDPPGSTITFTVYRGEDGDMWLRQSAVWQLSGPWELTKAKVSAAGAWVSWRRQSNNLRDQARRAQWQREIGDSPPTMYDPGHRCYVTFC